MVPPPASVSSIRNAVGFVLLGGGRRQAWGVMRLIPVRNSPDQAPDTTDSSGVMCTYDAFTHSGRFVRDLMYLLL